MKNKIALLSVIFISAFIIAKAQTVVPNANMEQWTDNGSYDDPNSWATPNSLIKVVFQDSTNVFDGNYSARLVCTSLLGIVVRSGGNHLPASLRIAGIAR